MATSGKGTNFTDAQVQAALFAFYQEVEKPGFEWRDGLMHSMREALEAAASAAPTINAS